MSAQQTGFYLFEGHVARVEKTSNGRWCLVQTKEHIKPLAIELKGFTGLLPEPKAKVSVQAREGIIWYFAEHRSLVIENDEPFFPIEELPNAGYGEMVAKLILNHLKTHPQVSSDDIYDSAMSVVSENTDPRFIGHGFRVLSKRKVIHKVGMRKSTRTKKNHARDIAVWELTKEKKKN